MSMDLDPKAFVLADPMSDQEDGDSDREVEIALAAGLVDARGLRAPKKKPELVINKVDDIKKKLFQMKSKTPWINTVDVIADEELVFDKAVSDDFAREALFFKQGQDGATKAIAKLRAQNIPVYRPADYFAEMVKSDEHMHKIRKALMNKTKEAEKRENARRLRTEKKFAVKVQRETEQQQRVEKRRFMEAVKKHKKGMKGQLETMLNNARSMDDDEEVAPKKALRKDAGKKNMSRTTRNKKFGFGGRKSKRNDKQSFENFGLNRVKKGGIAKKKRR